ncbi:MAG: VCBS repeat-containing protein [Deltaproteobacteria bacterium]|nr:VCBS repeat-containing protein [Deltaproteobacteria bacterium]
MGLAPPRLLANRCELDHICIVADLDGARGAELAHIARGDGKVRVERLASVGEDIELIADPLVTAGFCADADARCAAAPWDKSPGAELVWIDEAARVHAAGLGENTEVQQAPTPCDQGVQCRLVELDGSVGAEWLAWQNGEAGVRAFGADGASRFSVAADCGTDRCEFADLDGDGRTDILQADPEGTLVWSSSYEWELPLALPQAATCGTEDRCLWADLNGDRFDDLVRITPDGDVHLHPTLDARGRLEAASLALSSFSTAQWRSRIADAQAELTANLSALGPDFVPADTSALPPAVYQARRTQLMDAVASAIAEVRGSISSESEVDDDEDVRRIQEYAMFVAVGRTILAATPLGTSARGTDCANVVVHESTTDASWPQSTPSYLFAYARALRTTDRELQTQQMVDALTAIHGGFRCLNHGEIARLDAAWSDAVLETAADLADAGHEQAVRWLLDNALPITLLTFDAAKYSTIPGSYRLLRARFDGRVLVAGDVPDEGFDFEHAADDPACESFVCRSYDLPRRALANGRGLVLDRLGVWLPDPMRSGRLQRVDIDPITCCASSRISGSSVKATVPCSRRSPGDSCAARPGPAPRARPRSI